MPEFDNDFSNNLFSDLAPLLTLFGEQVTIQFLSMSMGWADNILLSMGPLGVVTIIVSAIRVAGDKRLKALIGRSVYGMQVCYMETKTNIEEHEKVIQWQNKICCRQHPETSARCGADNKLSV